MLTLSKFLHLRLQGAAIDAPVFNGKDSGQAPPSTQTVQNTNLPDYAQPYFTRLLDRSESQSQLPYATFTGPRVQPLSGNQNLAVTQAAGLTSLPGQIGQGSNYLQQAGIGGLNAAQSFNPSAVSPWMNPYQQNVIDIQKREANRQYDMQDMTRRSAPNAVSALGGYRDAIMTSQNDRNRNLQLNDIQLQGSQQAYDRAVTAAGQQAQLGLAGYQNMGQAGQSLVGAGVAQNDITRGGIADLMGTGAMQQQQGQQALDVSYNDFRNSMDFPRQQLAFMSGILRGLPVQPGSDITQYQAPPNPYSQLLGLGIAGAGLSKLAA